MIKERLQQLHNQVQELNNSVKSLLYIVTMLDLDPESIYREHQIKKQCGTIKRKIYKIEQCLQNEKK